jgi:hypothetical protein
VTDQIVEWLFSDLGPGADEDDQKDDDEDRGIDVSQLGGSDGDNPIDSPVTGGADPSSWDPIDIERNP